MLLQPATSAIRQLSNPLFFFVPQPLLRNLFLLVKVKVKFSLEQATKAQRGSRFIGLLFLQTRL